MILKEQNSNSNRQKVIKRINHKRNRTNFPLRNCRIGSVLVQTTFSFDKTSSKSNLLHWLLETVVTGSRKLASYSSG